MLQIILLDVFFDVVNKNRTEQSAESEHRSAILHRRLTVKGALRVH